MFRTFLGYSNILITMVIFILPKSAEIKLNILVLSGIFLYFQGFSVLGSGFESAKIHFFLFSDSRDPIIYYHKLRKLKFASHFIIYQNCPLRGHFGTGRLHSQLWDWGVKSPLTTDLTTLGHIFGIKRQNSIRIML